MLSVHKYSIIALTETWCDERDTDSMLGNINYNIFRCNRDMTVNKVKGGGVMTLVSKDLNSDIIFSSNSNYELLIISLKIKNNKLVIINVYIPPLSSLDIYIDFINNVNKIKQKYQHAKIIIVGDFNLPKCYFTIDKNNKMDIKINNKNRLISESALYLYSSLKNYNFIQYNTFNNSKFNILDLIFSDSSCSIDKATFPLTKIDIYHVPLIMKTKLKYCIKPITKIKFFNYKKANYANIFNKLDEINWKNELNNDSVNVNTNRFYEIIMKIIEEEVPKTLIIKDQFPKFFSKKLKRLIKVKKIYQKKYKDNSKSSYYYNKFKNHRKMCKFVYDQEYKEYLKNIEDNLKIDQKPYWYYVNDIKKMNYLPKCTLMIVA